MTFSTFRSALVAGWGFSYAAYAAGMTILVGVLAVSTAVASTLAVGRMRSLGTPVIGRLGAVAMVLTGV